jgi:SAM-dependent methyltransferase
MAGPAEDIIGLYERHARHWAADRARGPWLDRGWHERFAAALTPAACVLDLGCGAGFPIATFLAERGFIITGVDAAPTLIEACRARLPEHTWHLGDMRALALDQRFDGILAWDSFFHLDFDDQRALFPRFAAHSRPGALLMLNTGPAHGEAIGTYRGDPLYHASLDAAEYTSLFDCAGLDVIAHVAEDPIAGGRTVWLARSRVVD